MELYLKRWTVKITLHKAKTYSTHREVIYYNTGLTFQILMKYDWYFRYLAAMQQVKTPKFFVQIEKIEYIVENKEEVKLKHLKNNLKSAMGNLTKNINAMERIKRNWSELFPYYEDIYYQKAVNKIEKYKSKVIEIENEINKLENQNITKI